MFKLTNKATITRMQLRTTKKIQKVKIIAAIKSRVQAVLAYLVLDSN